MKQGQVHVTITANADPLVRELRRAEKELARTRAARPRSGYWRAFDAGRRYERALAEVRAVISNRADA